MVSNSMWRSLRSTGFITVISCIHAVSRTLTEGLATPQVGNDICGTNPCESRPTPTDRVGVLEYFG